VTVRVDQEPGALPFAAALGSTRVASARVAVAIEESLEELERERLVAALARLALILERRRRRLDFHDRDIDDRGAHAVDDVGERRRRRGGNSRRGRLRSQAARHVQHRKSQYTRTDGS